MQELKSVLRQLCTNFNFILLKFKQVLQPVAFDSDCLEQFAHFYSFFHKYSSSFDNCNHVFKNNLNLFSLPFEFLLTSFTLNLSETLLEYFLQPSFSQLVFTVSLEIPLYLLTVPNPVTIIFLYQANFFSFVFFSAAVVVLLVLQFPDRILSHISFWPYYVTHIGSHY